MKKINLLIRGLTLCVVSLALQLSAETYSSDCCCDIEWSVGGEALYWEPCGSRLTYGNLKVVNGDVDSAKLVHVDPCYDWGFNIYVDMANPNCGTGLRLNWTHFKSCDSDRTVNPESPPDKDAFRAYYTNLFDSSGAVSARGSMEFDYDRVNLRAYRNCFCCNNFEFGAFAGISYLNLEQKRKVVADIVIPPDDLVMFRDSSCLDGGAGEVGIMFKTDLCSSCFYLLGEAGIIGGVAERTYKLTVESVRAAGGIPNCYQSKPDEHTICFPGIEYKFELGFAQEYCGCEWKLKGGYESVYYHGVLLLTPAGNLEEFPRKNDDLGFAGPYFGASVCMNF